MKIARNFLAMALAIAIVPTAFGADPKADSKKEVRRTIVVKDGRVFTSDGAAPMLWLAARGFLGVQMIDLTPELREHFRVQKDAGVLVGKVVPESPAAKAGIRVGDKKKGDNVKIDYSRDGANATAMATVVERERKEVDLRDLDIETPDIQIPGIGKNLGQYFNSPEWKVKVEKLQNLPDCGQMQDRMRKLESKMKDLEKRLGQK